MFASELQLLGNSLMTSNQMRPPRLWTATLAVVTHGQVISHVRVTCETMFQARFPHSVVDKATYFHLEKRFAEVQSQATCCLCPDAVPMQPAHGNVSVPNAHGF